MARVTSLSFLPRSPRGRAAQANDAASSCENVPDGVPSGAVRGVNAVHLLDRPQTWDPFPAVRHHDDTLDRRDANRAVGVSAIGLAVTGFAELAIAVLTGSVGLLGD